MMCAPVSLSCSSGNVSHQVPMTYAMPCGVFVYWSTANMFSLSQTLALKIPGARDMLDIPAPPAPPERSLLAGEDPMANPIKTLLAKAKGENTTKTPVSMIFLSGSMFLSWSVRTSPPSKRLCYCPRNLPA